MKKFLIAGLFLIGGVIAYAAPPVFEMPITDHETPGFVVASTSSWTAVPTSPLDNRVGLYVTVQSSATANMYAHIGTLTTPTLSTDRHPILLKPGITQFHKLAQNEYFYVVSQAAAAEGIEYEEVKQ